MTKRWTVKTRVQVERTFNVRAGTEEDAIKAAAHASLYDEIEIGDVEIVEAVLS